MSTPSATARYRELANQITRLFDERRFVDALPLAREQCELAPERWGGWADRAVAAKHAGELSECFDASLRAIAAAGEDADAGLYWNLGIAATALADWPRARSAWKQCGLEVPGTEGPIHWKLGAVPIRIAPAHSPEVVWCERICPARAIIRSVPLPETGRRTGDVVLHDGEPRGTRLWRGQELAVFDELALLEQSPARTRVVQIEAPAPADVQALHDLLAGVVEAFEDWTASIELLCKACSEGTPHEHPATERARAWKRERRIAIGSAEAPDDALLAQWERGGDGRRIVAIEE